MAHNLMFLFLSSLTLASLVVFQGTHAVEYQVSNNVPDTPGGQIFNNQIGIDYTRQTLESASKFVWQIFGQSNEADRKPVQRISLFVRPIQNPAETRGDQILVNSDYIASYRSGDVKEEITGVIYHEVTHVWQEFGTSEARAPPGLIEGIADFVRLKANHIPSHWVRPGGGDRWDQGYDKTARFLDYCESLRGGFVAELNKKIRTGYNAQFFVDLLGKTVDQLWTDYKARYRN